MNDAGLTDLVPASLRRHWSRRGLYPDRSLFALFRDQARAAPERPAVLALDGSIRYGELLDAALRLAAGWRALGIVASDVIAYQLPNHWHACAIDLAAAALGAIVAPFPPGRGRLDIAALLRRCQARAVVVVPQHGDIEMGPLIESLRPSVPALRLLVMDGGTRPGWQSLASLLAAPPLADHALPDLDPDAPARLLVSSGTESEPKLVAYSHNALAGGRGRFLQRLHPDGRSFRGLYLVPLGSAFGATATFGALCWLGGSIALLPGFDPRQALAAIASLRPTHLFGVPTMLQRLAAEPTLPEHDISSLVALVCGGAVVDAPTVLRCSEAFGCRFVSLYGSVDGVNCHNLPGDAPEVPLTSVGKPNPEVCDIRIVDSNRHRVPTGEIGEIAARGPMSPMQYVNAPELDATYRDAAGWMYTGDLGYLDAHGYLVLTGRKKDVIIRGGANISPVQIEALACGYPEVVSAACVAVPDADLGQRVGLCLAMRDAARRPALAELVGYLRERGLETNKLPEYLRFVRHLPLTPAGKVDKRRLAAEFAFVGCSAPSHDAARCA